MQLIKFVRVTSTSSLTISITNITALSGKNLKHDQTFRLSTKAQKCQKLVSHYKGKVHEWLLEYRPGFQNPSSTYILNSPTYKLKFLLGLLSNELCTKFHPNNFQPINHKKSFSEASSSFHSTLINSSFKRFIKFPLKVTLKATQMQTFYVQPIAIKFQYSNSPQWPHLYSYLITLVGCLSNKMYTYRNRKSKTYNQMHICMYRNRETIQYQKL